MRADVQQFARFLCVTLVLAVATQSRAAVVYNESVNGDLSNNYLSPTNIPLSFGSNLISASSLRNLQGVVDMDLFHVTLPSGGKLIHLYLASDAGPSGTSFMAVEAGTALTFDPDENTGNQSACFSECLGFTHFGPNEAADPGDPMDVGAGVGDDLLIPLSVLLGNFTPPLTGTHYTFWTQENSNDGASYSFNFVVAPEPTTWCLGAMGAVFGLVTRRRRS